MILASTAEWKIVVCLGICILMEGLIKVTECEGMQYCLYFNMTLHTYKLDALPVIHIVIWFVSLCMSWRNILRPWRLRQYVSPELWYPHIRYMISQPKWPQYERFLTVFLELWKRCTHAFFLDIYVDKLRKSVTHNGSLHLGCQPSTLWIQARNTLLWSKFTW
jgi:hypothetical protein